MRRLRGCTRPRGTRSSSGLSACVRPGAPVFRRGLPRFVPPWRFTAAMVSPARRVVRGCSGFVTPTMKPTTVRAARPKAACWPTEHCRDCSRTTGPERRMSLSACTPRHEAEQIGSRRRALLHCDDSTVSAGRGMNAAKIVAIVLIAAGVLGLIYHGFRYTKEHHEPNLGSLELSLQHKQTVDVPEWLSVGAIVAGVGLLLYGAR